MFINEETISILTKAPLFASITITELSELLPMLSPRTQTFRKGEMILRAGQQSHRIGILLEGELSAFRLSPDGTTMPVPTMAQGSVFGDILGGASVASPVTIQAVSACEILWLPYQALLHPTASAHPAHGVLLQNLLRGISDKYFELVHRVDLLVLKSLRAKLSAYLLGQASEAKSNTFAIPFTRAQLADYLNCERSALSREIGRMQQEGLIETCQKSFKLLQPDRLG